MSGKKWILLVSGSKGWERYKHQANVCLHYQIIKEHGIPDEQIVVMMYDDIAHNSINPSDGEIISVVDSKDVYKGVPKDYTRADVTPENFLSALQGKNTGKKVIASGPNDNIFIYMTGVGKEGGSFQFPEKGLYPSDFTDVLKSMHAGKKFAKMVIYMDSDYSGGMFEGLPRSIDVFALTSCHKYIENIPTDYDDQREVYLSDLFSSTWLKYLKTADFKTETFHELVKIRQSKFLAKRGAEPCPCRFGDEAVAHCHLSDFLEK